MVLILRAKLPLHSCFFSMFEFQSFQGPLSWGETGFSPQMQFPTAFLDHSLPSLAKLPALQLKFDDQIAGNHIFKHGQKFRTCARL